MYIRLLTLSLFCLVISSLSAAQKPNVLLILTDDQGYGDVASHGNKWLKTPHHDQLAAAGARFKRYFVSPVCAPTRASILTGRWHLRTGVHGVTHGHDIIRTEEVTLAEIFKANGYATGAYGKWHNGEHYPHTPNGQGFDEFVGFCAGHWNNYFDTILEENGKFIKSEGYIVDYLTTRTIEFIEKNQKKPWFAFVPFNTPHLPWQAPEKYWKRFKDNKELTLETRCAYAMVENIDDNIGRLMAALDRLKLAENTIVLFMSDNGANTDRFNVSMKGRKGNMHEGGTRVPLFIRWTGKIKPGTVVKPITAHVDLLPTLVELTGVKMGKTLPLDGKSLVPLLNGHDSDWPKRTLFSHWKGTKPNRGTVRTDRWRAVKTPQNENWELYDMQVDSEESMDLAQKNPEVLTHMKAEYMKWFADVTKDGFEQVKTEIGHDAAPDVNLYSHEADLRPIEHQGISFGGRAGFAFDYVAKWTDKNSYPAWPVKVIQQGTYDVTLFYAAAKDAIDTEFELWAGKEVLKGKITKAFTAQKIPSRNVVGYGKRPYNTKPVPEYIWAELKLGSIDLAKGELDIVLKALSKPGKEVMQLKEIALIRQKK
jgi:arylsulfatase A-like enzyme